MKRPKTVYRKYKFKVIDWTNFEVFQKIPDKIEYIKSLKKYIKKITSKNHEKNYHNPIDISFAVLQS